MVEYRKLDELCNINMGQSPDSMSYNEFADGLPFFQGNADFGVMYPIPRIWCNAPIKVVEPETLLISVRAPIGALNFAKVQSCIGRGLAGITSKEGVNLKYIYYCLQGKNAELNRKGTGSTFKAIAKKDLGETVVKVISEEEQTEIIQILDMVSAIIENRQQQLTELDNLIKARFVEMFGNPIENPKGWKTLSCRAAASKIGSGATPRGGRGAYETEGISLIRSMNVYNNRFEYKDLAHITNEQAEKLDNVAIEKKDVLLNITGASVARCCIVPDKILPARVNQHVSIIRCKEILLPEFVCHMLTEDNYQKQLWSIATSSGATREAITKQQIEELIFITPPLELQNQFAAFVRQVDKSKSVVLLAVKLSQLLCDKYDKITKLTINKANY